MPLIFVYNTNPPAGMSGRDIIHPMNSVARLRGALFGCGMISEYHLRGWNRIGEVEIVALCNRTISRAEQRRDQFLPDARVYADLDRMLAAERLDFIDILTTPALHREHCLKAAAAGLHVICQKPLCDTWEDAVSLGREMASSGRIFAVHENHRYRPWFTRVREELRRGTFGNPSYLHIQHINATYPGEAYKNESAAGVMFEYGSHLVDMMRCLLGEPSGVYARFERPNRAVRGESLAHAVYRYPEATAIIDAGWKNAALTQGSFLLTGDEGEAYYEGTLTRGSHGRLRISRGDRILVDEQVDPFAAYRDSFYLLEREFTNAALGRGTVTQTAQEHLASLRATFAAYESVRQGEIVNLGA